jgi:hypothetical protein
MHRGKQDMEGELRPSEDGLQMSSQEKKKGPAKGTTKNSGRGTD